MLAVGFHKSKTMDTHLSRAVLRGGIGFCLVSLVVFATVAFGERWMYARLGELGAYVAWTLTFLVIGGLVLGTVVDGSWRLPKFYLLWGVAFFAYAAGWVGAYFIVRDVAGEWIGSLVGSVLMTVVFALGFSATRLIPKLSLLLFVANSAGYFLGSALNDYIRRPCGHAALGHHLRPPPRHRPCHVAPTASS